MVKHEHLRLRRELLGIASSGIPGYPSERSETRLMASLSADGIAFSLIEGYRRRGIATLLTPFSACMLAKIEGNAVRRALELAGGSGQFDADDSGVAGVRLRRH